MKTLHCLRCCQTWLFLFIGALSFALSAKAQPAQPPLIQSQKVFTDFAEYFTPAFVAKASDGKIGIITIGQNLKKFSATGDEMWTTSIPAQDAGSGLKAQVTAGLAPTLDGGFTVLAYDKIGAYLTKFNANGTRVWAKKVVDDRSAGYLNLITTKDGGFLVTEERFQQQINIINRGTYVTKFNQDGNLEWQTVVHYPYDSSSKDISSSVANAAISLTEGGYLLLGLTRTFTNDIIFGSWVAKLDSRGGVIWQKRYNIPIPLDAGIESPFGDGSYIAAGYENLGNLNYRTGILTIQSDGTLSNTLYITNSQAIGNSGFKLSIIDAPRTDGVPSYTIFDTGTQRQGDFRLTNIGQNNQVRWTKFLGGSMTEIAQDIVATDNGYAAIGLASSRDGDLSGQNISNQGTWLVNLVLPTPFALQSPTYTCATGAFTFNTTGGDGSPITYRAPGITGPTTNPNQFVDADLRQAADAKPISLSATQSGVTVTYLFDLRATCPVGTTPPTPPTGNLALTAPTYECATGVIKFNTTGGDGSTITYTAPGITRTSLTSNTGTVEQGLRNDPKPITIQATQSGKTASYLFDFAAFCSRDDIRLFGVDTTFFAGSFDYKVGEGSYDPSNPIDRWTKTVTSSLPELYFNYRLRDDKKTYTLHIFGQKDNRAGSFPITITIVNPRYPNQPITNRFTLTFKKYGPEPGNLTLTAPTYNCTTGAIKFNTAGGNGTLIEYQAPGITGWTTNPNQFVDKDSRTASDVKPFTLMARQSGNVVTYTWDLKQACGRARVAAAEAEVSFSLQLLGNPVRESVQVLIQGAEGQAVQLRLTDMRGRLLESRTIEQVGSEEVQRFRLDQSTASGLLLLQATQHQQTRTVRIIRQ